jgi:hypothetical protein
MDETWQTPTLEEIAMNAEIGAYQDDGGRDDRSSPIVTTDDEG